MKTPILSLSLAALAVFFLSGCGNDEEQPALTEADVNKAAQEAQAESDQKLEDKLASGFADLQKSSQAELAKAKEEMQAELNSQLAAQRETLLAQFEKNNQALSQQVNTLSTEYANVEDQLPESDATSFQEKLPELQTTVQNLQELVAQFSPDSIEQLEEFKTKYQKEFTTATQIAEQLMQMLQNARSGSSASN